MAQTLTARGRLSAQKVTAIPNPVDVDGIRRLANQTLIHPWLAPGEPPLFLAVGRLTEAKDYPTLLAAFAQVRAKRSARLVILGAGELKKDIEAQLKVLGLSDDAALLGFQSNPYPWMKACSVYVMSSAWEGFPNSLAQAMACGARIVSTDCPTGPAEILENGIWGRLVPVGQVDALAEAMNAALDDPASPDVATRVEAFRAEPIIARYEAELIKG